MVHIFHLSSHCDVMSDIAVTMLCLLDQDFLALPKSQNSRNNKSDLHLKQNFCTWLHTVKADRVDQATIDVPKPQLEGHYMTFLLSSFNNPNTKEALHSLNLSHTCIKYKYIRGATSRYVDGTGCFVYFGRLLATHITKPQAQGA